MEYWSFLIRVRKLLHVVRWSSNSSSKQERICCIYALQKNSRSIEEMMLSRPNKSEAQLLGIIYWKPRCSHHWRRSQSDTVHVFHCVSFDYFSSEKSYRYDKIPHPLDIRWLLYQSSVQFSTHTLDRKHNACPYPICILAHLTMVSAACWTDNSYCTLHPDDPSK